MVGDIVGRWGNVLDFCDAYKRGGRGDDMGRAKDEADAADEVAEALRRDGAGWRGGGSDAQAAAAGEASRPAAAAEKMREMLAELLALYGKYATEAK